VSEPSERPRARDIGLRIGVLDTGCHNAITDVEGVRVGHTTLIHGSGKLVPGEGPVRTGVTAIIPHGGNMFRSKLVAYTHVFNGFGKSVGLSQVQELGTLETPVLLTNTLNVGRVADALVTYMLRDNPDIGITASSVNPVVGECNDGHLNDIQGRHVGEREVLHALDTASAGPVQEGAVGGGTGMRAFGFKGGIGTASRSLPEDRGGYTVGVLVQANFGRRYQLTIDGVPVGRELREYGSQDDTEEKGSIMMVLATDAPLTARQLGRVARRTGLGLARTGSVMGPGSGDYTVAFSTAQHLVTETDVSHPEVRELRMLAEHDPALGYLFTAAVEATEEAVLNALLRAETVEGRDGHVAHALPIEETVAILKRFGRV